MPGATDLDVTKAIWEDVIGEFPKMWLQDVYEGYQSEYWQLPPRTDAAPHVQARASADVVRRRQPVELGDGRTQGARGARVR